MSDNRIEAILKEIAQLPVNDRNKLRRMLDQGQPESGPSRRVAEAHMPESGRELKWLTRHAREYAGQWVALDGDRLIAHSTVASEVFEAADADGARLPLVTFVEDPDKVYAGF